MSATLPPTVQEKEIEPFEKLVHDRTGIVLRTRRIDVAAILADMAKSHSTDLQSLRATMTRSADGGTLFQELVDKVTVNETHFFRNKPQFDALEHRILPELIRQRRATKTLRIWSAGCSTGEEPYSIAALLHRMLPDLAAWRILILATDISQHALDAARIGVYGNWSFRQCPPEFQTSWFEQRGRKFQLSSTIKNMVTFSRLNLAENCYPSAANQTCNMDIILCRNVFIYFDAGTTATIINRLYHATTDEGWLLVGHSEPSAIFGQFTCHEFPGTTVYQKKTPPPQSIETANIFSLPSADTVAPNANPSNTRAPAKAPAVVSPPSHSIDELDQWVASGKHAAALLELKKHVRFQPDNSRAHALAAKVYVSQMKWPEASEHIHKALAVEPLNAVCHYVQGLIHQETGNIEGAIEAYRHCIFLEPSFLLAQYMTALNLRRQGPSVRLGTLIRQLMNALRQMKPTAKIPEGDGLTAGQMLKMVEEWKTADE